MKKMLIVLAFLSCILLFFLKIGADTTWANGISVEIIDTCGNACFVFKANNVPEYDSGYVFFWFFDDGSFDITTVDTVVHTFQTFIGSDGNSSRLVYAEVTKLYEKDDKPSRLPSKSVNILDHNDEISEPIELDGSKILTISSNRNPVPGDSITYILTYGRSCEGQTPGTIKIKYDTTMLNLAYNWSRAFHGETISIAGDEIIITLSNISFSNNLSRRVFLTFFVDTMVKVGDTVGISGNIYVGETGCLEESEASFKPASLSHDPNSIVAEMGLICGRVDDTKKLKYTVHFQNIGSGPADEVEVRTYLPLFFSESAVTTTYPPGLAGTKSVNNREIIWKLTGGNLKGGAGLRGIGEPGYGGEFTEDETKDSVQFEVKFDTKDISPEFFDSCISIVNRAEITFDCNPPISTNFFETVITCDTVSLDSSTMQLCACVDVLEEIQPEVIYSGSPILVDISKTGKDVVWYPPVFISDPLSFSPSLFPPRSMDYVAVVRKDSCSRVLFRFPVRMNCDLAIEAKLRFKNCDQAPNLNARIIAKACTKADEKDLVWNWECVDQNKTTIQYKRSGKKLTLDDCPPGVYHLTVKNTANGCWAEKTIYIPAECSKPSFPWKKGLIGALVLVGVLVLYGILKKKKP